MHSTLSEASLSSYLSRQLENHFPDGAALNLPPVVRRSMARLEYCFSHVRLPGYQVGGNPVFDHLHSDQYAVFLYFASNSAWAEFGDVDLAKKLFYLNKVMNGVICMYDTKLPDIFLFVHSIGVMIGKASYSDYLAIFQNVTIGTDRGNFPAIGQGVIIHGGSAIIGNCKIEQEVTVSAQTLILNSDVPRGSVVAGRSPHLTIKPAQRQLIEHYFIRDQR